MKRTVPLLIAAVCGVVLIITSFIPATVGWGETAAVWFDVLAGIAFVLGGGNLLKIHLKKVSDRAAGWAYSLITVLTFLLTLFVGMVKLGVAPAPDQEYFGQTFAHLSVAELPEELQFSLPVDLPAKLAEDELPASVRSQLELIISQDEILEFRFRGWITGAQTSELLALHDRLDWKCAIEQLSDMTRIPADLAGKVTYHADHRALAAIGRMTPETVTRLNAVSSQPEWTRAVQELETESNRTTSLVLSTAPPAGWSIPETLTDVLTLDNDVLTTRGPLTPAMKGMLVDQFARVRPLTQQELDAYVAEVEALPGSLTETQRNLLVGLEEAIWNSEQLISTLNAAGERKPGMKTYCQLLDEQQAGVAELVREIPPTEENVEFNDAQKETIRASVSDPNVVLTELGEQLQTLGPWLPSQQAALLQFLNAAPTIGEQGRILANALIQDDQQLSREQFEFFLADYRLEHQWREQIHQLYVKSHEVKYPWSGSYLQDGTPFWWSYEYALKPLTATMFALLAFYVASAAFRAFRYKNFEALLLLLTAFIILLGRTYSGVWLTSGLPDWLSGLKIENLSLFILQVINTAGNRAIMIGISLGIVSTSLKILLGVDRSYLGSGDD